MDKKDVEKQLRKCHKCGKTEVVVYNHDKDGKVNGAVAQCPDNHYARLLAAPGRVWAALG